MCKLSHRRLVLLLDIALVLLLLLVWPLSNWMLDVLPDCVVAQKGYLCPACGSTRCIQALLQRNLPLAFRLHPLLCLLLFHLATMVLFLHLGWLADCKPCRRVFRLLTDYRLFIVWGIAYALFGILRNIL